MTSKKHKNHNPSEMVASQVRSLLTTVNGLTATYTDNPLELKSSMLASMVRSLTRCLGLCQVIQQLEEQEPDPDYNNELHAGRPWVNDQDRKDSTEMDAEPDPLSLVLLEEVLVCWHEVEKVLEAIRETLEANPKAAQAHMLDTLGTAIAHSIKFNHALEDAQKARVELDELDLHGGTTREEKEMLEEFEELEREMKSRGIPYEQNPARSNYDGSEDHLYGTAPYKRY